MMDHENESKGADRFISVVGREARNRQFFRYAPSAHQLHIERTDATKNMTRFYALRSNRRCSARPA
ncbi:hypothetical protein A8M32_26080 [Sinorhizobium alkalisoli]|uniref:Uncharacterized protein n=1 Tax=Sinorhizobium alkalisoli TaxID=1752398 RepID=A0A1E3V4L2_9HYPH|nr:hypothetical protein A8M32_26080 [Sinorhizobium alkalisoli]